MRDALSIMDKIVSFTNGELNYANTLEHLNILDADYYFRLMDCMLQQDLAGAMLLYDDINRKGFEGDQVLNGFAEFIRNLLVCKDSKAAVLLEAVENFRDRYADTAKNVPTAVLISALNILNEAEINYRAARNKRLHVELTLIKLCYLQQALQLSADTSGVVKKKRLESAKPVAFRQIAPVVTTPENKTSANQAKKPAQEEKLIIQTTAEKPKPASGKSIAANAETTARDQTGQQPLKGTKLSALDKIRKQYKGNSLNENAVNHPIQVDALQKAWTDYTLKLKEARNPAAQPFEMAELRLIDENSFEVITANNIQQKFIEQERNELFSFLQGELKNRMLQFNVIVVEKPGEQIIVDAPLSTREQFLKMAEEYPLLVELKERLRFDLDY